MTRRPTIDPAAELDPGPLRVTRHTPTTIRDAQLVCAGRALAEPDPDRWLGETLDMLGIGGRHDAA